MLESKGLRIAAISYDSVETLRSFADSYGVHFPLLSDGDSTVIRSFGIFNYNIAAGLRAHGVPHPVEYLVSPDGVVVRKYFVPNYQNRVSGAAVALTEFGAAAEDAPSVRMESGAVQIQIGLSSASAFAGQQLGFFVRFGIEPGWHVYDTTTVRFEEELIVHQNFALPAMAEYSGIFETNGSLLLRFPLPEGQHTLRGRVEFQQCGESVCEPPESVAFELPIRLGRFLVAEQKK